MRAAGAVLIGAVALAAQLSLAPAAQGAPGQTNPSPVPGATTTSSVLTSPPGADAATKAQATNDVQAAQGSLAQADKELAQAQAALQAVIAKADDALNKRNNLARAAQQAADRLSSAQGNLRQTAVAQYVTGGNESLAGSLLHVIDVDGFSRGRVYGLTILEHEKRLVDGYTAALSQATAAEKGVGEAADRAAADRAIAEQRVANATAVRQQRVDEVSRRNLLLQLVTAAAPVAPSDIPALFLDGYIRAAAAVDRRYPNCSLHWSAIAAIGRIESNHGREGGAVLTLAGDVYPRIIGPALDGSGGFALIADTDQGRLDGDPVFDHAVGPMQFIPSSWAGVAQDGNGDGIADPNNAYDATMATAVYLCRAAPGSLESDQNLYTAALSYNHNASYAQRVVDGSHTYDALHLPGAPPGPANPGG